jgi:hypothetical protein
MPIVAAIRGAKLGCKKNKNSKGQIEEIRFIIRNIFVQNILSKESNYRL